MKKININSDDATKILEETKKLNLFRSNHRKGITKDGSKPFSNVYGWTNKQFRPSAQGRKHKFMPKFTETKLQEKNPEYGKIVGEIVKKYFPYDFYYNCITINRNCECKKHTDASNMGTSIIIGLGDYENGELIVENDEGDEISHDIKNTFTMFDGSKYPHYTNSFSGERYSLIFYNNFPFDYRIAIPTYKRPKVIYEKTLKMLERYNVNMDKVDIFIENEEMMEEYLKENPSAEDINFITHYQEGIGATRNFINMYYQDSPHVFVLHIDDDIESIKMITDKLKNNKPCESKEIENFEYTIRQFFGITMKNNLNIFGIMPLKNEFFLKKEITTKLKYIAGGLFGVIYDKDKEDIICNFDHLEDYERSILYYKRDCGVLRVNGYFFVTKTFTDGGINDTYGGKKKRYLETEKLCKQFKNMYSEYATIRKKKDYFNIQLKL